MIDMVGKQFGRLTVIAYAGTNKYHSRIWECKCVCGNTKIIDGRSLRTGSTRSCGCLNDEVRHGVGVIPNRTTHGMSNTRLYRTWKSMRNRCNNPNNKYYYCYGGKGIRVCDEWNVFENFQNWALMNGYTESMTIERIDTSKNYEPQNCTWIKMDEQSKNKSSNRIVTINGETHIISEWCKIKGISYQYLWRHEKKGESTVSILTGRTRSPKSQKEGDNP